MTREEAIKILDNMHIELAYGEDESGYAKVRNEAIDMAISALSVIEQTKWERDTALATLEEHGIGLGQIAEPSDLISRADAIEAIRKQINFTKDKIKDGHDGEFEHGIIRGCQFSIRLIREIKSLPSADRPTIVRCKDCEYRVHCHQTVSHTKTHEDFKEYWAEPIDFCSRAKMKGGNE